MRRSDPLSPERFTALYDKSAPQLARWLSSKAGPEVAQELLAETFATAWCARRTYDARRGDPQGWVFGIAANLLASYYRRRAVEDRARRRLNMLTEPAAPAADDSDARLDAGAWAQRLRAALDSLPARTREAVALRVVDELDYDELAAQLGCSNQAARLRVSRGLRALRVAEELQEA